MTLSLQARRRVGTGKGAGRRIRANGLIPAVLYGNKAEPVNLAVEPADIKRLLESPKGRNATFTLEVNGGETVAVAMIKDWQKDPVRRTLVHCDLIRLDPTVSRKYRVPIKLVGVSPAEKAGAKVRFITRHIKVTCLPGDIPEGIEADISVVGLGGIVRLADIVPPSGVELHYHDNAPVFSASTSIKGDLEEGEAEGEEGEEAAEE